MNERWVVERVSTGEWLATNGRGAGLDKADFGANDPLMYAELKSARRAFMRWSCKHGYVKRGVTLPGVGVTYEPAENFDLWPSIVFRRVSMLSSAVSVESREELLKEAP